MILIRDYGVQSANRPDIDDLIFDEDRGEIKSER